jgi:DNA-binding SARP family transcriptional activator
MSAPAETPEFLILGPLEVRLGGRPVALGSTKQRALLAALLLRANEVVPTERLIDELWGDAPPRSAANALQVYVSQLRKTLGADVLVTQTPGYVARAARDRLDAARFEDLVDEGRRAMLGDETATAATRLREALALWRGDCLPGLELFGAARSAIAQLEELQLAVHEDLIRADLSLGHHGPLLATLEALVEEHPYRRTRSRRTGGRG